ncbi:hypothetical protein KCP78_19810 [Salmonella enterica subsp. enterica]|nr:hypothetical protein KCP78_19810 [Salmonella enterica subsp. enterica]
MRVKAAENIARLSALQSLGFSLVEGEVNFCVAGKGHRDQHGAEVIARGHSCFASGLPERRLRRESFSRAPWYAPDARARFYAR